MKTFAVNIVCRSCKGTGLYVGMGERSGAAVICHTCKGTGCEKFQIEYEPFTVRKDIRGIRRVYKTNPGICIGDGNGHTLEEFGGMPFKEWEAGLPFPSKSENRMYTCPAWWYQQENYKLKPDWETCIGMGSFSSCKHFSTKAKCWKRWDKENKVKT
jgi:hypothetical protein